MLCPYHFCPLLYPSLHEMSLQSSSVGQPCPTFCNPWTAASQASLSITNSWNLLKSPIKLVMPSNHLILCHPLLLQPSIFSNIRVFCNESFFTSGGQSTEASASASVLPMNIQSWFPLGLTGLILPSKGFSRVFSSTTVRRHQLFGAQLSIWFNSHIQKWLQEKLCALLSHSVVFNFATPSHGL